MFGFLGSLGKGLLGGIKSGVGQIGKLAGQNEALQGLTGAQRAAKVGTTMLGGGLQGAAGDGAGAGAGRALGGMFSKAGGMFGGKRPDLPTTPNLPSAPMRPGIDAQPRFTGDVQVPETPVPLGQRPALAMDMEGILQRQKMDRLMPAMQEGMGKIEQATNDITQPIPGFQHEPGLIPELNVPRPMIPRLPGEKGPQIEYDPRNPAAVKADARYDFITDRPGRNWKTSLQNAVLGAARAYQANPNGGLGSALGGALGGGIGATFNPIEGRDQIFEATQLPRINDNIAGQQSFEDRQLKQRGLEADIGYREAQRKRAEADANRTVGEATWGTYDTRTGEPIWQRPQGQPSNAAPRRYSIDGALVDADGRVLYQAPDKQKQKPMTVADAMAEEAALEGEVEQIAQDSLQGRQESLLRRLPQQYQAALNNPDDPYHIEATRAWEKLQNDELAKIRRETSEKRKTNANLRQRGQAKPAPMGGGRTAVSRAAVEAYAQEKGISVDEAMSRFQQKGIQVR